MTATKLTQRTTNRSPDCVFVSGGSRWLSSAGKGVMLFLSPPPPRRPCFSWGVVKRGRCQLSRLGPNSSFTLSTQAHTSRSLKLSRKCGLTSPLRTAPSKDKSSLRQRGHVCFCRLCCCPIIHLSMLSSMLILDARSKVV